MLQTQNRFSVAIITPSVQNVAVYTQFFITLACIGFGLVGCATPTPKSFAIQNFNTEYGCLTHRFVDESKLLEVCTVESAGSSSAPMVRVLRVCESLRKRADPMTESELTTLIPYGIPTEISIPQCVSGQTWTFDFLLEKSPTGTTLRATKRP